MIIHIFALNLPVKRERERQTDRQTDKQIDWERHRETEGDTLCERGGCIW